MLTASRALDPRGEPSQARSRATVQATLEAATWAFATHSFAGGTANQFADRAGVSVDSLVARLVALAFRDPERAFDD